MDFLDRLKELSESKNVKNNFQLAEQSGVPYTTIDNFYRNGYQNAKLSTLKKLASFFGCSVDYLLGDIDDPTPPGQKEKPATNGELERITSIFMELPPDEQQNVVEYVEFRAASRKKKESQ